MQSRANPFIKKVKVLLSNTLQALDQAEAGFIPASVVICTTIDNLSAALKEANHASFYYPAPPEMEDRNIKKNICMKVEKKNGVIHCILDGLLPHRLSYDPTKKKFLYRYDRSSFSNDIRSSMEKFLTGENIFFQPPVLVYFVSHIPDDMLLDLENLDPKVFIDSAVSHLLVPDDHFKYVRYYMDATIEKEGTDPYTEIWIGEKRGDVF